MIKPFTDTLNQKSIKTCFQDIGNDIKEIVKWSTNSNLVFNDTKTKFMLLATNQMNETIHS